MIAASLKNAEGDPIIDLLLKKGADVSVKSSSGQVRIQRARSLTAIGKWYRTAVNNAR